MLGCGSYGRPVFTYLMLVLESQPAAEVSPLLSYAQLYVAVPSLMAVIMAHVLVTLHLEATESLELGSHQVSFKHTNKIFLDLFCWKTSS